MSARPEIPPEDAVTVEINGRPYQARKGAMIIEVTDNPATTKAITIPGTMA